MGQRHRPNLYRTLDEDRLQFSSRISTEQPCDYRGQYPCELLIGRTVAPLNSSFHRTENLVNDNHEYPQSILGGGSNGYPTSHFRAEGPNSQLAVQSCDYRISSSAAGNLNRLSESYAGTQYSAYYNRCNFFEADGVSDLASSSTIRGPFKRKTPDISAGIERGSGRRSFSEGSSSLSGLQSDIPFQNYQDVPTTSAGLQLYGGYNVTVAAQDTIAGHDTARNVRSRSGVNLGPPPVTSRMNFPSQDYHSTNFPLNRPGTSNPGFNARSSQEWNYTPIFSRAPRGIAISDANVISNERNHLHMVDIDHASHGSIFSGSAIPPSRYIQGHPFQAVREGLRSHNERAIPAYGASASHRLFGYETAASEGNIRLLPEPHHSRYRRSYSAGSWHGSYRNAWPVIAERLPSRLTATVDSSDVMVPETLTVAGHANLYSLGDMYDQYEDMRLDVDSMSYEELLALEERIGSVNIGLSESMIMKCLTNPAHVQKQDLGSCVICLEEFNCMEEVGRLKSCGHDYHVSCIKKWLSMKNACPICKGPAVAET